MQIEILKSLPYIKFKLKVIYCINFGFSGYKSFIQTTLLLIFRQYIRFSVKNIKRCNVMCMIFWKHFVFHCYFLLLKSWRSRWLMQQLCAISHSCSCLANIIKVNLRFSTFIIFSDVFVCSFIYFSTNLILLYIHLSKI